MARLLITGGSSYLGQHLVPMATQAHQTSHTYLSYDPLQSSTAFILDVRDLPAVQELVERLSPEIIIHTVGSNRPADMEEVIESGTENIVAAAGRAGARLIHISSDVVFDGRGAPYTEDARPNPMHAYGRAKARAESMVASLPDHVIIRTSLIYGLRRMDRGTAWIVSALNNGRPVTLFTDQLRNPVWVESLCSACLELAVSGYQGILNVAGDQVLSRAEFGNRMLDWWQIKDRAKLSEGKSDPEIWPQDCTLDINRARAELETPLPGVDAVLQRHGKT